MELALTKDIIEWDVVNWGKALHYWEEHIDLEAKENTCLELGGRGGGLSLWMALKSNKVVCSDYKFNEEDAQRLHQKYNCMDAITYEDIDATSIPYRNHFDVIAFKSILGGICRNGNDALKKKTIDEIHAALNENGKLVFAENLTSSFLHRFMRKRFTNWGATWNYLDYNEIDEVFSSFSKLRYVTYGFFAAFGRSERQRTILGKLDNGIAWVVPRSKRYIVVGIAEK